MTIVITEVFSNGSNQLCFEKQARVNRRSMALMRSLYIDDQTSSIDVKNFAMIGVNLAVNGASQKLS